MARIWSDESRLETWLRVELADVAAFVDAVAERLGLEGRWIHHGLTSSDVVDTGLALQIQDAGRLLLAGVDDALAAVVRRAEEHRHTITVGRTHGIHAEPTTFGWKLAGWAFELDRGRARLVRALEVNRVGQLSGTVGTYAALDAELLATLALVATSLERFATEIRHLARTEVREVEEPFASGMKGSSAMPHKRNPKVAERICGLARVVRAAALVGFENVPLWHERDISHSSAERVVIPDAFLALDYMLDRFHWIVAGLVVYPERMRRNLDASHGLIFSHRLLLALVDAGLSRDEAYRRVQRHAMQSWEEGTDFAALVQNDPEIADRVDLASVFDLELTVRHVDVVFDRLHALVRKEEP